MIVDYYNLILLYLLIGFVVLFIVVRGGLKNPIDEHEIRANLGRIVLISVFGWPYSLLCWVCSWQVWFVPVEDVFIRMHIFRQEYLPAYLFAFVVLLFMNLMFAWHSKLV